MKPSNLLLLLLFLPGMFACESVSDQFVESAPTSLTHLSRRLATNHGMPVEAPSLEDWMLGEVPAGYDVQEIKASSVIIAGIPITEGRLVCTNQDGYLTFLITDYIQDSLSYLQLYRRYLDEAPAESPASLSWTSEYGGFGWMWSEPGADIHYLEAGILDRFHLRIRSNQTSANALLSKMGRERAWRSISSKPSEE